MVKSLEILIKLQSEINREKKLQKEIESIPLEVLKLTDMLNSCESEFNNAKAEEKATLAERVNLENELKVKEEKKQKLQDQLMNVKDNEQYRATLKDIDFILKEIDNNEEQILVHLETEDILHERKKKAEKQLANKKQEISERQKNLQQQINVKTEELKAVRDLQNKLREQIESEILDSFDRVADKRDRVGIARVKDDMFCAECHFKIRPQIYAEIKTGGEIRTCDNCQRVLYYLPSEIDEE